MKTYGTQSSPNRQVISDKELLERDRLNKELYKKSQLEQAVGISKKLSTAEKLEVKYQSLPPFAKMILNQLDSRSLKWSANPFNQQWLADSCGCSLRWVRHCIALLNKEGFIAIVRINRGKAYKTLTGWFKYPNIYIVSPFLRGAASAKLYSVIVAQAEKIQAQFLYLKVFLTKYYIDRDRLGTQIAGRSITLKNLLKKVLLSTG